jgi:hypothetical protein
MKPRSLETVAQQRSRAISSSSFSVVSFVFDSRFIVLSSLTVSVPEVCCASDQIAAVIFIVVSGQLRKGSLLQKAYGMTSGAGKYPLAGKFVIVRDTVSIVRPRRIVSPR